MGMGEPQAYSIVGQQQPRVHSPRSALLNLTTKTNRELFRCVHILQIKMVITQTAYTDFAGQNGSVYLGIPGPSVTMSLVQGHAPRQNVEVKKHKNPHTKTQSEREERAELISGVPWHNKTTALHASHF